jgi:hypothetical protein
MHSNLSNRLVAVVVVVVVMVVSFPYRAIATAIVAIWNPPTRT